MLTPKRPVKFASLVEPDTYNDKVIGYKITMTFEPDDPFLETIRTECKDRYTEYAKTLKGKAAKAAESMDFKDPVDDDWKKDEEGELIETGLKAVTFKSVKYQPKVFDIRGKQIEPRDPWGGSICRIDFSFGKPYASTAFNKKGTPLYLNKVQIIDEAEQGSSFEDESGGDFEETEGTAEPGNGWD